MFKKTLPLAILGLWTLCACDFPFSASTLDLANALTKKLNVPVFVWADPNSYCVNQQIQAFVDDYEASDPATREKIEEFAKSFRSIIIEEAASGPAIVGSWIELRLLRHNLWTWLGTSNEELDRVLIVDKRHPERGNVWPGTQLFADKDLTVSPMYADDRSVHKLFTTENPETFETTRSLDELDTLARTGLATATETTATGITCGKLVKLSLLAKKK